MKKSALLAWGMAGITTFLVITQLIRLIMNARPDEDWLTQANTYMFALILPVFAVVAALIISRQPDNIIGWLLFLPVLAAVPDILGGVEPYIQSFTVAPDPLPLRLWLSNYFYTTSWLLLIFPLFFIPVLFPTGRPPSPRWRYLIYAGLGMCGFFVLFAAFTQQFDMQQHGLDWILVNPIGIIPTETVVGPFLAAWGVGLLLMAFLSFSSLFIRYRRASLLERQQIKWLLFAVGLFGFLYIVSLPFNAAINEATILRIANLLWSLSLLGIPISIGIAILRYRLWDIDLIIRRTLIYGGLTVTLALVFLGTVTLFQAIFSAVSGQRSAVSVVVSTLLIAALFSPLLRRIQNDIDRRFYRKKYDTEQAIERFAATARQETDLEALSAELLAVVSETMQPESVILWLSTPKRRESN